MGKAVLCTAFLIFYAVYQYNQPMRDARCSAMLYHMLIELEGPAEIAAGDDSPMKHAMAYIQQHYREKLTLEDVARQVNLSPPSISPACSSSTRAVRRWSTRRRSGWTWPSAC